MIPYDKPVYKNGRRVLYHGPSRGGGKASADGRKAPAKAQRAAKPGASSRSDKLVAAPAAAPVAPVEPPAVVKAGALGAAVAAPVFGASNGPVRLTLAMDPRLGQELVAAMAAKGIPLTLAKDAEADLVVTPMPIGRPARAPQGVVAIARLYDCEVALVGSASMSSIADLAGKRVAVPPADTAAGRVARRVLAAAKVVAVLIDVPAGEGGAAMREGRADGFVVVSPTPRIDDAPQGARLLSVPYAGGLKDQFLPAELGKAAFPTLIERESVDTVAQPVILAAVDPDRDPARRAAFARFTEAFFSALGAGALPDAKWRDVNPAAKLPFSRFEAAQAWIDKARAN